MTNVKTYTIETMEAYAKSVRPLVFYAVLNLYVYYAEKEDGRPLVATPVDRVSLCTKENVYSLVLKDTMVDIVIIPVKFVIIPVLIVKMTLIIALFVLMKSSFIMVNV